MTSSTPPWLLLLAGLLAGCGVTGSYYTPPVPDAGIGTPKAAACATQFGAALSDTFGRLDGTVTALVEPSDTQCASVTPDALVVEVTANNAVYKVVVDAKDTKTTSSNTDYFLESYHHDPLVTWVEGWHPGGKLDYSANLGTTSAASDWQDLAPAALIQKLDDAIPLNARVTVYGTNAGGDESTVHLVHYQGTFDDGAILVDPGGANTWLLLHGDGQVF